MGCKGLYKKHIKRLLDIILSTLALIALSPILLITALLIRIKLGSPVVFTQARPGRNEKIFYLYKFRSMTNEVGEDGRLLPDAQRLTKFGKFLRSSSLDELLELVNIIKGDMSIVGPRPLSIYYLPHYPANLRRRHDLRPGLTGLAQVNGRNNLQWDERFALDVKYIDDVSFILDVKIILNTVLKVLKQSDISVRGTTKIKDYGPYCILKEESDGGEKMADMTYSEIGSYFWLDGKEKKSPAGEVNWLPSVEDSTFAFSGRNAIDNGEWEQGRYAVGTGKPIASDVNIRSRDYITATNNTLSLQIPSGFTVSVHEYSSRSDSGFVKSKSGLRGNTSVALSNTTQYVKFSFKRTNNAVIAPEDGDKLQYTFLIFAS